MTHSPFKRLLLIAALVLLASCAPSTPAPSEQTPLPSPQPTSTPQPSPRPTRPPSITTVPEAPATPSTLTLWAVAEGPRAEALTALIGATAAQLGVEVAVLPKSADALQADIRANALVGAAPPDMIWGSQEDLALLRQLGAIQPAADGLPDDGFIPATVAGASADGQRWGTPLAAQGYLLLLYNKKLVGGPAGTTDALISQSRALTGGERFGLVAGWAEARWFSAWLNAFDSSGVADTGAPLLDTPEMLSALNLLKELRASGPPPPSTYQIGADLFMQGSVAYAIDGDWSLEEYRQYTDTLDLGLAPMPLVPGTGRVAASTMNGIYLMYGATLAGAQLEQARSLGAALAQPAAQAQIAAQLELLPALVAAHADPAVQNNPQLAAAAAQSAANVSLPETRELRCAWQAIEISLPTVLLGEASQEDAARRMQENADACVADTP